LGVVTRISNEQNHCKCLHAARMLQKLIALTDHIKGMPVILNPGKVIKITLSNVVGPTKLDHHPLNLLIN